MEQRIILTHNNFLRFYTQDLGISEMEITFRNECKSNLNS